jgi:hypothetical protein
LGAMVTFAGTDNSKISGAVASASLVMLDPESILADPVTYQFRAGGDADGVTRSGRYNTDEWNPILHGDPILVHERNDGTLFVADGHHRLDLAKRSNAMGRGPGKIAALVLREKEGYTAKDVRVIAAYKNMAHGRTDPIDAARIFKEARSGDVHIDLLPNLQMDIGNLRLCYSLSKLSDTSLDRVAQGEVPADIGALVAEKTYDPVQQENVIKIISYKLLQDYSNFSPVTEFNSGKPLFAAPSSHVSRLGNTRGRFDANTGFMQMLDLQRNSANGAFLTI